MHFYFMWENESDSFALTNVSSYLDLYGFCQAAADGSYFVGGHADLIVNAGLLLLEWWNQPPTQPLPQPSQGVQVVNFSVDGGFPPGRTDAAWLWANAYAFRYNMFAVPPKSIAIIDVGASVVYAGAGGIDIFVDFFDNNEFIMCPLVAIELLTAPP